MLLRLHQPKSGARGSAHPDRKASQASPWEWGSGRRPRPRLAAVSTPYGLSEALAKVRSIFSCVNTTCRSNNYGS